MSKDDTNKDVKAEEKKKEIKKPSFAYSLAICLMFLVILSGGMLFLKWDTISIMIFGLVLVSIFTMRLGYNFEQILGMMTSTVMKSFPSLMILLIVGGVVGAWLTSGTIPTLIYYGLEFLSPKIFLPFGLIICSIMSVSCGTSWGTVGTLGIVLMGIGETMGMNPALVAGMVICGAYFGDKTSPISDSTNLAAIGTEIDVYKHIHSVIRTTGPSYIITLIAFTVIGLKFVDQDMDSSGMQAIQDELASVFNINIILILPVIITLVMSFLKFPALVSMISGIVSAMVLSIIFQGTTMQELMNNLNYGYSNENVSEAIYTMLNRGGFQSMMWTLLMSLIILAIAGVLDEGGYLPIIVEHISRHIKGTGRLVTAALATDWFCVLATGDSYSPNIITGKLYSKLFDEEGIDRSVLSRCADEGSTLAVPLVPWSVTGGFLAGTLGVATVEYAPFAIMLWLNPLISIIFAFLGIAIFRTDGMTEWQKRKKDRMEKNNNKEK